MSEPQTNGERMSFGQGLSTAATTSDAIRAACDQALAQLGGTPDLAMVFVSHDHGPDFAAVARAVRQQTGAKHLLGASGESIVGTAREVEDEPALCVWLARLPGVFLQPMRLQFQATPEGGSISGWPEELLGDWPDGATLLLLGEPFSFPADWLLERLNQDRPGVPVYGGMASGGGAPGENQVLLDDQAFGDGAAAMLVSGAVEIRGVVSQGCRPIGRPLVVTKVDRNLLLELGGRPALVTLQEIVNDLEAAEQELLRHGLHVGRVINEYQATFDRGDFLIRNCLGADPSTGAIAVGDYLRVGQTVQFHLRDATTADEDLRQLLAALAPATDSTRGALLFTCNGRGKRLFSAPDHDAGCVAERLGPIPVAGFFAQGEIGPIGGRNFIHGFTASVALFSPLGEQ